MKQPKWILPNNLTVVVHTELRYRTELPPAFHPRRPGTRGVILASIDGMGGNVYLVEHTDHTSARYCFDELEIPQPAPLDSVDWTQRANGIWFNSSNERPSWTETSSCHPNADLIWSSDMQFYCKHVRACFSGRLHEIHLPYELSDRQHPIGCPGPCSECDRGEHHFGESYIEYSETNPMHEAAVSGHEEWTRCKHCDAWMSDIEQFLE
jgi:hypothetical protein